MQFKINGTLVTKPQDLSVKLIDIVDSTSNMQMANGDTNRDIIAVKRQIDVNFGVLSWGNCSVILNLFQPHFSDIYYPDPLVGSYITKTFYIESKTTPFLIEHKGKLYWKGLSFVLIER